MMVAVVVLSFSLPLNACAKTNSDWKLVKYYCHEYYKGYKIVKVKPFSHKLDNRKGKKVVYVEKVVSISDGKGGGIIQGKWYIAYNKKVNKGKKVTSYCIYNPKTNYYDDIIAVVDNKRIR